ncbi:MAG: NTP transferase domain-containing protein, partial [Anaerolineales bacterium]|nr:NTP transferase domain-containing protein [Anaerolineales bacterium]
MKQIAAIILAAGSSSRFGQPKQLVDWQGTPLVTRVASTAWRAGLAPIIVVLGSHAEQVGAAVRRAALPTQTVMNWRWEQGLSTSVQTGLMALPPSTDAAIFLQSDQPLL